jgi:hypothetical protein
MSFFDLFNSTPAAPEPTPAPAPSPAPTAPASAAPTTPAEPLPLDSFKTLWDTDPNASPDQPFALNADPAKFMEAAKTMNFGSIIPPETLSAINQGGEAATAAFQAAMNTVAQATYAQSAHAAAKIVEMAVQKAEASFEARVPELIKRHTAASGLREENPIFNHPSAAPIVGALEAQMAKKYPNATANELRSMAKDYLTQFAGAVSPQKADPSNTSTLAKGEVDWDALIRM